MKRSQKFKIVQPEAVKRCIKKMEVKGQCQKVETQKYARNTTEPLIVYRSNLRHKKEDIMFRQMSCRMNL